MTQPRRQYSIVAPLSTHWRAATCAEAECPAYEHGWRTTVDVSTELGRRQARYIRKESGRSFTESSDMPGMVTFEFEAGQKCFAADQHRVRGERDNIFAVRSDDSVRGSATIHSGPDPWLDDFSTHQEALQRAIEG